MKPKQPYQRIKKEPVLEIIPEEVFLPTDFLKSEASEIAPLFKLVHPTEYQINRIAFYYGKYVNKTFSGRIGECTSCNNNISSIWSQLRTWWSGNASRFIN